MSFQDGVAVSERLRLTRASIARMFEAAFNPGPVVFPTDAGAATHEAAVPREEIQRRKILPPYLGEMGLEVRYFLAAVEPWLRNGWRIPARRPALYPAGTAFAHPALFREIDDLNRSFGARPVGCTLTFAGGTGGQRIVAKTTVKAPELQVQVTDSDTEDLTALLQAARLETALKQILVRHDVLQPRPLTTWDRLLTTMSDSDPAAAVVGVEPLVPSYLPPGFVAPRYPAWPHVGVQLRALGDARDSDVPVVMAAATAAAAHLDLPLLVYGHPGGTVRPAGHQATAALAPAELLDFELAMLGACRVMFAPNSGWFDLMCWLQVPTMLERQADVSAIGLAGMRAFRPRLALHDPAGPIEPQVDQLRAASECLPPADAAPVLRTYFDWDSAWIRQSMAVFVNDGNWRGVDE